MKMKIEVEGCPFEDGDTLKVFSMALDLHVAIENTRNEIRARLKWGDNLTEQEVDHLEKLLDCLYIEALH